MQATHLAVRNKVHAVRFLAEGINELPGQRDLHIELMSQQLLKLAREFLRRSTVRAP